MGFGLREDRGKGTKGTNRLIVLGGGSRKKGALDF